MTTNDYSATVFDRTSALKRVQGDLELLIEIIEIFLNTNPSKMEEIQAALAESNITQLAHCAHAVKGSAGSLSAGRAYDAALHLETLCRANNLDDAPHAVIVLEQEVATLREALEAETRTANKL